MFFHSISCSTCSCNARGEGSRLLSHRAALISAYIVSRLEQKMHNCTDAYSWCQMAEGHRLVEMPHLTEHPFRRTMDQYLENWKKKLKMRSKFKNWHWVRDVPRAEAEAFLWPPVQCSGDLLVSHCPLTSHTMHSACLSRARPIVLPVCHTCQLSENHSPALGSFSPHLILTYCYLLLELCSNTAHPPFAPKFGFLVHAALPSNKGTVAVTQGCADLQLEPCSLPLQLCNTSKDPNAQVEECKETAGYWKGELPA